MTTNDPDALTARLAKITGYLDAYIAATADSIAAPRIAAAQREAAESLSTLQAEHEARLRRAGDLEAELRRQLAAQLRQVAHLRWVARYLPPELRALVLADPPTPDAWAGERPDPQFAALVEQTAAAAGITAYPRQTTGPESHP